MPVNPQARFRKHPIIACVVILAAAWAVAVVIVLGFARKSDDLSDLLAPARQAADGSNAIPFLFRTSEAVVSYRDLANMPDLSAGVTISKEAEVTRLASKEHEALRLFRAAMEQPACVWPTPSVSYEEFASTATNWYKIYLLTLYIEEALTAKRNPAVAMTNILEGMEFANRVADCGAAETGHAYSAFMKAAAARSLRRVARDSRAPEEALRFAIRRLNSLVWTSEVITNVIKNELRDQVDWIEAGIPTNGPTGKFGFDAAATRRLLAPVARAALGSVKGPFLNSPASLYRPTTNTFARAAMAMVSGNPLGSALSDIRASDFIEIILRRCSYDNIIRGTRVVLALRLYERVNGRLPETLDELVPKFIEAIPTDGFDGKPLRYSKERRLVWSIGRDLKDYGGILRVPGTNRDGDQLFPLE